MHSLSVHPQHMIHCSRSGTTIDRSFSITRVLVDTILLVNMITFITRVLASGRIIDLTLRTRSIVIMILIKTEFFCLYD